MGDHEAIHQAAARLVSAHSTRQPCEPVRDLLGRGNLDDAYAVQQLVAHHDGPPRHLIGRKIGLTSAAVQRQMQVDRPDFGLLFADMAFGDDEPILYDLLLQPRVEAEVAFVLLSDLPVRPVTTADVIRATDFVVAAIEVVDSRIRDWDITICDTVADNASSGVFVLGGCPRSLRDLDLRSCTMSLTSNGDQLSSGTGAACLGHPVNSVTWLANELFSRGAPLRAGEVILSGSLGPLAPAQRGQTYEAQIDGLGSVRANFTT
jgi:2-keto-4-pentenoate hydratase